MKLGLKTIVLALVVALLCVPAAFAKGPGGHGQGKPSWAGGGGGSGHGKPAWAGLGKGGHADKAKAKHEKVKHQRAGSEDAAALDGELTLDDLNPAWYCKTLESIMDTADADATAGGAEPGEFSSFDAEFGTNDNKRNSFGKCVSTRAQGEDLSGALDDEAQQSCDQTADDGSEDPATDDGTDTSGTDEGTDTSGTDEGTDTSGTDEGTDTSGTDEGTDTSTADDPADDGSGDQADDCQADDSGAADDSEEGDQADDEQGDAADDQGDETEVAAFARALVRFIKL
jgi:hypothetical protein